MAHTLHKHAQEKWTLERNFEIAEGVVGTRLIHFYTCPSDATPADQGLTEGAAMPDAPSSGEGARALIHSVTFGGKVGTDSDVIVVVGFEAHPWE